MNRYRIVPVGLDRWGIEKLYKIHASFSEDRLEYALNLARNGRAHREDIREEGYKFFWCRISVRVTENEASTVQGPLEIVSKDGCHHPDWHSFAVPERLIKSLLRQEKEAEDLLAAIEARRASYLPREITLE